VTVPAGSKAPKKKLCQLAAMLRTDVPDNLVGIHLCSPASTAPAPVATLAQCPRPLSRPEAHDGSSRVRALPEARPLSLLSSLAIDHWLYSTLGGPPNCSAVWGSRAPDTWSHQPTVIGSTANGRP
jgi:hypothetical protein